MPGSDRLPVLMLHGWGMHGGVWRSLQDRLDGRPVLTPDLPGYGVEPGVQTYRADTLAGRMAERFSQPLILCGWSMGGLVAQSWAAMRPEQVRALVLISSTPAFRVREDWPHGMAGTVLEDFARGLDAEPRATLKRFHALQAHGDASERAVLTELRRIAAEREAASPATLSAGLCLLRDDDLRPLASGIACPTLVMHGTSDGLCPVAAATWLAAHIPSCKMTLWEGGAHASFVSDPAGFAAEINQFLRHVDT